MNCSLILVTPLSFQSFDVIAKHSGWIILPIRRPQGRENMRIFEVIIKEIQFLLQIHTAFLQFLLEIVCSVSING